MLILVVAVVLGQAVETHPGVVAVLAVVLACVAVLAGAVWWWLRRQRRIEAHRQWEIQVVQSHEIARYHAMTSKDFEHALAFLCQRDGCTTVRVVGGAGDLGADVVARAPDGRKIVLQAKRYAPTTKVVGPDLQKFGGTCFTVHQAHIAAVVTTSTFTKQARQYAAQAGILLFDHRALAGWATHTGPAPWH